MPAIVLPVRCKPARTARTLLRGDKKRSKDEFKRIENVARSQGQTNDTGNCMLRVKINKNRNKEIIRG